MRRILITGFAPDSRSLSPAFDKSRRKDFEIFSFNNDLELIPYASRHFEMHELSVYDEKAVDDAKPSPDYLNALHKGLGVPVYMLAEHDDIPGCVSYPITQMTREFETDYFTNSISYMLAVAIAEDVDEIHLYGIDMALQHESAWERPSIEYFLGFARGRGIRVVIPDESDMLKCLGLYGYVPTYEYEAMLRERKEKLEGYKRNFEDIARSALRTADWYDAALKEGEFWGRQWAHSGDKAFVAKNAARRKFLEKRSEAYRRKAEKAWQSLGEYEQTVKREND